jgi:integrase
MPARERTQGRQGVTLRNVLRALYGLLDAAKLPRVRFHDLRHSAASLLIAEGVELAEISLLLGRSELRVTADLYTRLQKQSAAKTGRQNAPNAP